MASSSSESRTAFIALISGFIGVCLLFISALLSQQGAPDRALSLALMCFAGALPLASVSVILVYKYPGRRFYTVPFYLSAAGVFVGIGATLWHCDQLAARVYIGAIALAVVYWLIVLFRTPKPKLPVSVTSQDTPATSGHP